MTIEVELNESNIYFINRFPTFEVEIDFNRPELIQNTLVDLTIQVENECPVAKVFGFDNTVGEGIVWYNHEHGLRFKVKGELHVSGEWRVFGLNIPRDIELKITNHMARSKSTTFTFEFLE